MAGMQMGIMNGIMPPTMAGMQTSMINSMMPPATAGMMPPAMQAGMGMIATTQNHMCPLLMTQIKIQPCPLLTLCLRIRLVSHYIQYIADQKQGSIQE
jgi:hypothetical protein